MNPSYCRIRLPKDDALRRFAVWLKLPRIGPLVPTNPTHAVKLAVDERGGWRGNAIFVSEVRDWTLIDDLSGGLGGIPAEQWLKFAGQDELVFAGYNDSIPYAELVVINGGIVRREFLDNPPAPEANVNVGRTDDPREPFGSWVDVAAFVDDDELGFCDTGWLWVY